MSCEHLTGSPILEVGESFRGLGGLLIDSTIRDQQNKGSLSARKRGGGTAPKEQTSSAAANSVMWIHCNQFRPLLVSIFTFRLFPGLAGTYYVVINILMFDPVISLGSVSVSGITE